MMFEQYDLGCARNPACIYRCCCAPLETGVDLPPRPQALPTVIGLATHAMQQPARPAGAQAGAVPMAVPMPFPIIQNINQLSEMRCGKACLTTCFLACSSRHFCAAFCLSICALVWAAHQLQVSPERQMRMVSASAPKHNGLFAAAQPFLTLSRLFCTEPPSLLQWHPCGHADQQPSAANGSAAGCSTAADAAAAHGAGRPDATWRHAASPDAGAAAGAAGADAAAPGGCHGRHACSRQESWRQAAGPAISSGCRCRCSCSSRCASGTGLCSDASSGGQPLCRPRR